MELNEFLSEFGKIVGVADLRADEDGHCALSVDDMVIHLQAENLHDALLVHGDVCDLPPECGEGFYRALLEMNYLFAGTRGATLSLKPDSNTLELAVMLSCFSRFSMDQLLAILESYINSLETIRKFITDYRSSLDAKQDSPATVENDAELFQGIRV